jgi:PAS domain S-box-containing protein
MSIDRKITLWTIGIVLVIALISAYLNLQIHIKEESESFEALGATLGPVVEASIEHSMMTKDYTVMKKTVQNLSNVEPIKRILLFNRNGVVSAASDMQMAGTRFMRDDPQCRCCHLTGQRGNYLKSEGIYRWVQPLRNKPSCHQCHPASEKHNGVFIIDFSVAKARSLMKREINGELIGFLPSLAVVGFGMLFLTRRLVIKRVNEISDGLRRFAYGDFNVRIPVKGGDELSRLGDGFNTMAEAVSLSQDELKHYADELLSLAVSSNVVTAVPRTENIYEAVCNVAVKELGLKMAWMGLVTEGSRDIRPVAQSGFEAGYLSTVKVTWDDSDWGRGPTGMAIKTKTPQVMNNAENDPTFSPWREEALKRGYRSSMALSLLSSDGDVIGVLNLYSGEAGHFTRKRVRLFIIFSNQVAAAIENRDLIEHVERRSAEIVEQLKVISRSQKEWQLTFDSITDLISIHDRDFHIIKVNRACAQYLGIKPEDIPMKKCYELFHDTCSPISGCPHRISMAEKREVTEEIVDSRTNRTLLISIYPYYSPEGEYIGSVHIARDVTEVKEKEMRLVMSERLSSLGQMASSIAHEINNPLASIAGCTEGLLMKVKNGKYDPALFEEYLQIILEEIQRSKNITTGMLSFVRKSAYDKKDVNLNEILDKTLEIIGFQGRLKDVEIVKHYRPDLPIFWGSEGEVRQVLLAIITNALDAMEDAGTLTLDTRVKEEYIVVTIEDTGPGIPHDHLQKIFDPFFTTKMEQGGTGLGLSIAHKIMTNHNGTITVSSEPGKGAVFTLSFPLPKAPVCVHDGT